MVTEEIDHRMMVQMSGLTIHGSPRPLNRHSGIGPARSGVYLPSPAPSILTPANRPPDARTGSLACLASVVTRRAVCPPAAIARLGRDTNDSRK